MRRTKPWTLTERLELAPVTAEDAGAIFVIHADARTYAHAPEKRMRTVDEAEQLAASWAEHWREHGFGYAAVRRIGEPEIVGFAGVKYQDVVGVAVLNLYYRFAPEAWGQGYAVEASRGAVERVAQVSDRPVLARIATVNAASERVVQRLGFVPLRVIDPRDPIPHRLWTTRPAAFGE